MAIKTGQSDSQYGDGTRKALSLSTPIFQGWLDNLAGARAWGQNKRENTNRMAKLAIGGDWATDLGRNVYNFAGDLMGGAEGEGQGFGDYVFGRAKTKDELAAEAAPKPTPSEKGVSPWVRETYQDPYTSILANLRGRSAFDEQALGALYAKAAEYIRGLQGDVSGIYDTAATGYEQGNQAAANAVTAGYDAARAQQAKALQALGIQDAAANILARGEDMSGNQTATTDSLARLLSANLQQNTAARTAALNNMVLAAAATQGEGTRAQAAYKRDLANRIAELEAQSTGARNDYYGARADAQAKAEADAAKAPPVITTDQYAQKMADFLNTVNTNNPNLSDAEAQKAAQDAMDAWLRTQGY